MTDSETDIAERPEVESAENRTVANAATGTGDDDDEDESLGRSHRFFVPEVIQSSGMDCGPATLKSLLSGYGIKASYGRLREACHTSVDGTSIDTLEELVNMLGLRADQEMMPAEHLLSRRSANLPALVVTQLPSGLTHFLVAWRAVGPLVQVMDPGRGRRWISRSRLQEDLYVHDCDLPAADVSGWLLSEAFTEPLELRLRQLIGKSAAREAVRSTVAEGWPQVAGLDAAVRTTERLLAERAAGSRQASRVFELLWAATKEADPYAIVPKSMWTATPAADDEHIHIRGAVLLKVLGRGEEKPDLPPELNAVVRATEMGAGRHLLELLRADGLWRALPLIAGLAVAGIGSVVETLLFRGAFDIGQRLAIFEQRLLAAFALLLLLSATLLIDWPVARGLWDAGRRLEIRLRQAFLHKLPRLGDRYFQSRPISDMAESSHHLHWVRLLPGHGGQLIRCFCELLATTVGVVWLHPRSAPLVLLLVVVMLALPVVTQPILLGKDLRMRGHGGSLSRFYLDALLGLSAIRAHTAEGALAEEHDNRLREWARAARDVARTGVLIETITGILGFGLAAVIVFYYLATAEGSGWAILLVYWVLMLPALGMELAFLVQQYPQHRNVTLRLIEPLGAEEDASDADVQTSAETEPAPAPTIVFDKVDFHQAANRVLTVDSLVIHPREHVAIVGSSGAGKSSLVGLLLGWFHPNSGSVLVDGEPVHGEALARLRRHTVWVDPTVQVWNRALLDNLRYGGEGERRPVGEAVEAAELDEVLARLPMGLQTVVGAGGALLSGGEGQRVRLGRGICRGRARMVILDEAFCGLERHRRLAMLESARERWKDATLICISHDIAHTRGFGRVLVIENGCIVEDGHPDALAACPDGRYARLLDAEQRALDRMNGPEWRRLEVRGGYVTETKAAKREVAT